MISPIANRTRAMQLGRARLLQEEEAERAADVRAGLLAIVVPAAELGEA